MHSVERTKASEPSHADSFGSWCLDQAFAATDASAAEYFIHKVAHSLHSPGANEGLSRETVEERIRAAPPLKQAFKKSWAAFEEYEVVETEWQRESEARRTEERKKWMEWRDALRSREMELRENRADPEVLHQLALAYLGRYTNVEGDTPCDRLRALLDDDDLIAAVLDAFRRHSSAPTYPSLRRSSAFTRRIGAILWRSPFWSAWKSLRERYRSAKCQSTTRGPHRRSHSTTRYFSSSREAGTRRCCGRAPALQPTFSPSSSGRRCGPARITTPGFSRSWTARCSRTGRPLPCWTHFPFVARRSRPMT